MLVVSAHIAFKGARWRTGRFTFANTIRSVVSPPPAGHLAFWKGTLPLYRCTYDTADVEAWQQLRCERGSSGNVKICGEGKK